MRTATRPQPAPAHRMRALLAALPLAGALLLAGCTAKDDDTAGTGDTLQEQGATASQSLGMLMEASSEAVLSSTTSGGSAGAARADTAGGPAEQAPDLTALRGVTTIDLATFTVNGQPLFPTGISATGSIVITTSGSAATSWPAGTTTLFTGSLSVALTNVVISNQNGDTVAMPSGTFTHTFDASSTKTDDFNWDITTHAVATVSPALNATLTHGGRSIALTLGGNRTVDTTITRRRDLAASPAVNKRTVARTVSGTTAGSTLSTVPALAAHSYTAWTVTVNGLPVRWNRFATVSTEADYTKPVGSIFTVTSAEDRTYITVGGIQAGPKTALEWALTLKARLAAEYL